LQAAGCGRLLPHIFPALDDAYGDVRRGINVISAALKGVVASCRSALAKRSRSAVSQSHPEGFGDIASIPFRRRQTAPEVALHLIFKNY